MDRSEMRRRFTENTNSIMQIKRNDNKLLLKVEEYNDRIGDLLLQ